MSEYPVRWKELKAKEKKDEITTGCLEELEDLEKNKDEVGK